MVRIILVLVLVLVLVALSHHAHAQIAVYDPAVTWQNRLTAAQSELQLITQRVQHTALRDLARRLTAVTSLAPYAVWDPPLWRIHGPEEVLYGYGYTRSLNYGDAAGTGYVSLAHPLVAAAPEVARLSADARRGVETQLATIELADASAIAATHDSGQLRFNGRAERQAIGALVTDVVNPSLDQSATAILDKVSGAVLIGARQRQARLQLVTDLVEQLLVDSKRARDAEAVHLNMQVATWLRGRQANQAFRAGRGDALRTWRQP